MECNSVAEFCSLFPIKAFIFKSRYYKEYCKWCEANNRQTVSNSQFGKQVLALEYRAERYSFGSMRNTYYTCPNFDNSKSQTLYKKYLARNGLTEFSDIMREDNPSIARDRMSFDDFLCDVLYNKIEGLEDIFGNSSNAPAEISSDSYSTVTEDVSADTTGTSNDELSA